MICKGCFAEKSTVEFYPSPLTKSGFHGKCKECISAQQLVYRKLNKAKVYAITRAALKRGKPGREALLARFRSKGCLSCGQMYPGVLCAHHVDPSIKEYTLGGLIAGAYSQARIKREIAKTVCVCFNCHRMIHDGFIPCPELRPLPD